MLKRDDLIEIFYDDFRELNHDRGNSMIVRKSLKNIEKGLNRVYRDIPCKEVSINENNKMFFGMRVLPDYSEKDIKDILTGNKKNIKANSYKIEIDSKLLDFCALSTEELIACLIHEVGHVVADTATIDVLRSHLDQYLTATGDCISDNGLKNVIALFKLGVEDAVCKIATMFNPNLQEEYIADRYSVMLGFADEIESSLKKINKYTSSFHSNKLITLSWVLGVYKNFKDSRLYALRMLKDASTAESSKIMKEKINNTIMDLKRYSIPKDAYVESTNQTTMDYKIYKELKRLNDDVYLYNIRLNSTEEEREALSILHDINSRMSLVDSYIEKAYNLNDTKFIKDATKIYNKFDVLRQALASKKLYKDKSYGLFVKMPEIQNRYAL